MNTGKYSLTARILHWVSATIIVWATLSGFFMALLAPDSATRASISWINVSLTTLLTPLFVFRAVYALRRRKPRFLQMPAWQMTPAHIVHLLLYVVTAVVLTSGIMMMQDAISVFDVVRIPNPLADPFWNAFFYRLHRYACVVLLLLLLLHVGAVVRHHRAGRPVLVRMT